jgi:hypothetical protein
MPELHLDAASMFLTRLRTVAAERMGGGFSESLSLLFAGELSSRIATDLIIGKAEKKAREDAGLAFV